MDLAISKRERARRIAEQTCDRIGASLKNYLGSGAHKDAFLISLDGELLALKIAEITAALGGRFEREIAALQSCSHPAIAKLQFILMEKANDADFCVIAEEFLAEGTLLNKMTAGLVPFPELRHLGNCLADAIAHMEERNLVHRDIKPANILFRRSNEPVLTDFGIVRVIGEPSLTHDFIPQGPGTPLYASPEQLNNDKALIDWRTDQFGLALVLAECVLGRAAFSTVGGSLHAAVFSVASRATLPEESRKQLEDAGFGCLVKALSPWPIQRFRRPREFLDALTKE